MGKKYVYYIGEDYVTPDDIQHFEFPKIKLPDLSNVKLPNLPKIELPKVKLPSVDIGKEVGKAIDSVNPFKKSNKKDYEWKNHKWKARKRDKNGKWIYDYGNGFPGENKKFGSVTIDPREHEETNKGYKKGNAADKLHGISKVAKFLEPFIGAGMALLGPTMKDRVEGGKMFVGSMIEHAKDLRHKMRLFGAETDKKTGFPKKKEQTSKQDDLDSVNPGFHVNDNSSQNNCPCCTVAYDLRRRGYEVIAREDSDGASKKRIAELYNNPDIKYVVQDNTDRNATDAIDKAMSQEPNGSTGYAFVQWGSGGGHIFNYEIENGHPVLYDAQSGQRLPLSAYAERCTEWNYFRTDNIEPNYDSMREFVE